ncbi:MAG: hypothetical protein A4E62_02487 [Syntrophorhabdus sp. PtaU1.Bin002]|nr:MAG: hypothetical protein A4E62_02487 [Syntrophorhabdus sp. PtaU1.Bin002]
MYTDKIVGDLKTRAVNTKDIGVRDALTLYEFGKKILSSSWRMPRR